MQRKNLNDQIDVIRQLLNTYLAIRVGEEKYGWKGIDLNNPPKEGVQHEKLASIVALAQKIPPRQFIEPLQPWIEFIYLLDELEEKERASKAAKGTVLGVRFTMFIRFDSLFERTLHAIRASVIKCMKQSWRETTLKVWQDNLINDIHNLDERIRIANAAKYAKSDNVAELITERTAKNKKLTCLVGGDVDSYCDDYHKEIIKPRDEYAGENTFADYSENVRTGKRKPTLLNNLLTAMHVSLVLDFPASSHARGMGFIERPPGYYEPFNLPSLNFNS